MLSVGEPGKGGWLYLGDVPYKQDTVYEGEGWITSSENSGEKEEKAGYGVDKGVSDTTTISWKVSLNEAVLMAVAPCGGPIAMLSPPPSRVWIFSQAGRLISDFATATTTSTIVALGWTHQERLLTVALDGSLILRTIQGDVLTEEHLFESLPGGRGPLLVDRAEVYQDGAVALLTDGQLFVASTTAFAEDGQLAQHTPNRRISMYSIPWRRGIATVTAMVVREPSKFQSGGEVEVVIATDDCAVVVVGRKGIKSKLVDPLPDAPAIRLAASSNGKFLALFTAGGMLAVMRSDFQTKVLDFDTSTRTPPTQLVWCGEDCVVLHWPGLGVLLVGPYGDWERIQYPGSTTLLLFPELDCCRVFTGKGGLQLLRRVPPAIAAVASIGSTDPAAMLVDMVEASVDGDPKADESIRTMAHDQLTQAVMSCLTAACQEMEDANRQKQLLRAVSHGKSFLQGFDSDIFVSACREIRVLHTIRNKDGRGADLPLTYPEFEAWGADSLIARLTSRRMHLLAFSICQHLRLPGAVKAMVVRDWVKCCLASRDHELISDYKLREDICLRMELCGRGVSYVDITHAAIAAGRRSLAIFLLEDEPLACNQVQILLEMGVYDRALSKALLSADEDLVFLALSNVMHSSVGSSASTSATAAMISSSLSSLHNTNNDALLAIVQNRREALQMLNAYFSARGGLAEWKLLLDFYLSIGDVCGVGGLTAVAAYAQPRLDDRIASLHEAERLYAKSKDTAFHQGMTNEQIDLLQIQRDLEKTLCAPGAFVDASLYATVHAIITTASMAAAVNQKGILAEANKLQRKFKISDARFWHIKLKAFAEIGNWGSLRVMAHERRSPIGYMPFVKAAIQQGNRNEAEYYIEKVTSVKERTALLKQLESLK